MHQNTVREGINKIVENDEKTNTKSNKYTVDRIIYQANPNGKRNMRWDGLFIRRRMTCPGQMNNMGYRNLKLDEKYTGRKPFIWRSLRQKHKLYDSPLRDVATKTWPKGPTRRDLSQQLYSIKHSVSMIWHKSHFKGVRSIKYMTG